MAVRIVCIQWTRMRCLVIYWMSGKRCYFHFRLNSIYFTAEWMHKAIAWCGYSWTQANRLKCESAQFFARKKKINKMIAKHKIIVRRVNSYWSKCSTISVEFNGFNKNWWLNYSSLAHFFGLLLDFDVFYCFLGTISSRSWHVRAAFLLQFL